MAKSQGPEILRVSARQVEELLVKLRAQLSSQTYPMVESLLRTLLWIMAVLEQKKTTLGRLRDALFGSKSEKTAKLFPEPAGLEDPNPAAAQKARRKGHGRKGSTAYPGARRIPVPHPQCRAGSLCPECLKGKLYLLKKPARLICIIAQPLFNATLYELERWRCALCGKVFTAPAPAEAGAAKYDPNVGLMLAIQRYGAGLPMYRIAKWQEYFGVPMPASTQWELIDAAAALPAMIYERLIELGAQGTLIHNDDTFMRVQSLRQEIAAEEDGGRTGIFTTNLLCQSGSNQIALFFTGRKHAGENLDELLKRRAAELDKPLQMCDGLSRNTPRASLTDLCHCLLHGRRNFVDQIENFPEECRKVIESLREVYRIEAQIKEDGLSDADRLAGHQAQSGPVMEDLHQWMKIQLDQKKVEPNSGLGRAIGYMLNHWEALTRFLKVPGAPLDNNVCERALKMAILHRKNSLSYNTLRGAQVGDIFMSLIHTCQLNGVNPFDYMTALQTHAGEVSKDPAGWLPWNYHSAVPGSLNSG
jgi:transposase